MGVKKNKQPIGSCSYCWEYHDNNYVTPTITPKIIFLVDHVGQTMGRTERFLQTLLKRQGIQEFTILPANPCAMRLADTKTKKRVRETLIFPYLDAHPGVPVVAFGESSSLLIGGKCSDTSSIGKECVIEGHICAFTYSYDYYLENGRDKHIMSHIETTINSSLVEETPIFWSETFQPFGEEIVIDIETSGVEYPWYGSELLALGVYDIVSKKSFCFRGSELSPEIKNSISKAKKVIGHNVTYDIVHLNNAGFDFSSAHIHDTLIYHKNSHPNELSYGLKFLAKKYFSFPHWEAGVNSLYSKGGLKDADWGQLCTYNVHDLLATYYLYMEQQKSSPTFSLEMDYLKYVIRMIMNGMHVDMKAWEEIHDKFTKQNEAVTARTKEVFGLGPDFNFNSPDQVLHLLRQYFPTIKSTGADILAGCISEPGNDSDTLIKSILELRDGIKLVGTGLAGLRQFIDTNSLVHSSYSVHGAETGRSSSSRPNMQNTDPRVRKLFTSRYPDGKLVHTDLSGIEYRLIGHASADPVLLDVFNGGKDIHDEMYLALFGEYPPNKERRKKAKTANFCGVYGGGYKKFCISAELPDDGESKRLFKLVSGRYPGVAIWKESVLRNLRRTQTIRNLFNRVRRFDYVNQDIEREAINWIIQSSGHDILKIYSMEMCDAIQRAGLTKTLLVSEVHDSNTFDSPRDEYERAADIIRDIGSNLNVLIEQCFGVVMKVPIFAEIEIMDKWS